MPRPNMLVSRLQETVFQTSAAIDGLGRGHSSRLVSTLDEANEIRLFMTAFNPWTTAHGT
jgi:hypothetical protein